MLVNLFLRVAYVLRLSAEDALQMSKLSVPGRGSVIHESQASIIFSCVPPFHDQEARIRADMQVFWWSHLRWDHFSLDIRCSRSGLSLACFSSDRDRSREHLIAFRPTAIVP